MALTLIVGVVYTGWASREDSTPRPIPFTTGWETARRLRPHGGSGEGWLAARATTACTTGSITTCTSFRRGDGEIDRAFEALDGGTHELNFAVLPATVPVTVHLGQNDSANHTNRRI